MSIREAWYGAETALWPDLLNKLNTAVAVTDAHGRITFANTAFEQAFELRREELAGAPISRATTKLLDNDGRPLAPAALPVQRVLATGEQYGPRELRYETRDGTRLAWAVCATPLHDDAGCVEAIILTITDVTELKRTMTALEITEKRFRDLAEQSRDLIAYEDLNGVFQYVSPASYYLLGYDPEEMIGRAAEEFVHPDDAEVVRRRHATLDEDFFQYTFRAKRKDGAYRWLDTNCTIVRDSSGEPRSFMVICRDITDRRIAAEIVARSEADLALAQEIAHLGSFRRDYVRDVMDWSKELYRIFGVDPQTYSPRTDSLRQFVHPDDVECVRSAMNDARSDGQSYELEHRIVRADGSQGWVLDRGRFVYDEAGRPASLHGTILDITDRKTAEERVAYLGAHDLLTGLPNRRVFVEYLTQVRRVAQKRGIRLAVLCIGLDRFKVLNDSLGHDVGDALLKNIAERIQNMLGTGEFACRLGGDAFCMCVDIAADDDIVPIVERIHKLLDRPHDVAGRRLVMTTSIGVSVFPNDAVTADELLMSAESTMYRAKAAGRDTFQLAKPELHASAMQRLSVEQDLRRALSENQLVLHYQPIVDLQSGKIAGCETLLRWQHPERGLLRPSAFIAEAEETGLIVPMGEWVFERACDAASAWIERYDSDLFVAINVSARQLNHRGLLAHVERSSCRFRNGARQVELELVESTVMEDPDSAMRLLARMKAAGIRLAVDDFGTGYSSLAYLKRFPLDTVKIDRSFVRDLETDENDAAIAEAIVNVGHALGLRVVAEGVETEGQLHRLRDLRCDAIQGHYFSPAVPAEEFESLLAAGKHL